MSVGDRAPLLRGEMMDLPSFLWLWRLAAWSMGLVLLVAGGLTLTGWRLRSRRLARDSMTGAGWWRGLHLSLGLGLVGLVLILFSIGIVGTLGEYGRLGHSVHLGAGVGVMLLTLGSAFTGWRQTGTVPGRQRHLVINGLLLVALLGALWSGWVVVQKYLP